MTARNPVVVSPSLLRLLAVLLLGGAGVAGGVLLIFGPGPVSIIAASAVGGLILLILTVAFISDRPRLVITPEGFTVYKLVGEESRKWQDIDGNFAVIRLGLGRVVAYHLTAACKAQLGAKPATLFAGYDAAISGAFRLNAAQLAELLNKHASRAAGQAQP